MNENVKFILGEKSLILEIVGDNKGFDVSDTICIAVP